jgi:hypothetical protein
MDDTAVAFVPAAQPPSTERLKMAKNAAKTFEKRGVPSARAIDFSIYNLAFSGLKKTQVFPLIGCGLLLFRGTKSTTQASGKPNDGL